MPIIYKYQAPVVVDQARYDVLIKRFGYFATPTSDNDLEKIDGSRGGSASGTRAAPVCGEFGNESTTSTSNGTNTGTNTMVKKTLPAGVSLQYWSLRFSAAATTFQQGDRDIANSVPMRASVSLSPTGPWVPVSTRGMRVITIEGGTFFETDPFFFYVPPAGTVYVKTYVNLAQAGHVWPIHNPLGAIGTTYWSRQSASEADLTADNNVFNTTTGTAPFAPVALVDFRAPVTRPSLFIVGDSLASGLKDNNIGFVNRAIDGVLCHQRGAVSGVTLQHYAAPATGFRRMAVARGYNVAFEYLGTNDLNGGRSLALLQADKLALWSQLSAGGTIPVFTGTVTPWTDSGNAWADLAGQTVKALEANRVALNDWVRAGAPIDPVTKNAVAIGTAGALVAGTNGHPLYGYFDVADAVEPTRNAGKWKADPTSGQRITDDGVHPLNLGHILMAATIDIARIRAAVLAKSASNA